jgi:hypothetical protein
VDVTIGNVFCDSWKLERDFCDGLDLFLGLNIADGAKLAPMEWAR